MKDLVLLVADKNAEYALKGAFEQTARLGIHPITFEIRVHPGRDGGVRKTGSEVLARERRRFSHALLVMDFEGCGADSDALTLEAELDGKLRATWNYDSKAIVIEPEVDVWMWGSDNAIRDVIDWPLDGSIREWLREKGFGFQADGKPLRPKEAMEAVVEEANQPRSSALYCKIASSISLRKCTDAAFQRLRQQLVVWFPE